MQVLEIAEHTVVSVKVTDSVFSRIREMQGERCLGCEREFTAGEKIVRGCCVTCYAAIRRAIQSRRISERELIREGRILAATKGGRRPQNAISRELAE